MVRAAAWEQSPSEFKVYSHNIILDNELIFSLL